MVLLEPVGLDLRNVVRIDGATLFLLAETSVVTRGQ